PPPRTTDVFASKLRCANLGAVTGRIGVRTPKTPEQSASLSSFALTPNNVVGRVDLTKESTGYPEDASVGVCAKAVHIPVEADYRSASGGSFRAGRPCRAVHV